MVNGNSFEKLLLEQLNLSMEKNEYLHPTRKCIIYLNVKLKTVTLLEENIEGNLCDLR